MLLQLFTTFEIVIAATTVVPFCFQGHSEEEFLPPMFFAFLLFNRFLHGLKIIIFKVVYQKACDIPWKRNITVYICLFSYFDLTFYISQEQ